MTKGGARAGFTLIEIMISVAIVGLLAAIAIPNYSSFLLRAKRAEVPMQLDSIRTSEFAYVAEWDQYTSAPLLPADMPGRVPIRFVTSSPDIVPWELLGWEPDGRVYGQYEVNSNDELGALAEFTAEAYTDIDGDQVLATYRATQVEKATMETANDVY
jgi:prepilin-type N-terminal cleavage/methylation domain-containing protein